MSSFVVIGDILDLYSRVQRALRTYGRTSSNRGIDSFGKDLEGQELIFKEFLHVLRPVGPETKASSPSPQATRPSSIRSFSQGSFIEPSPPYAISLHEEARESSAIGAFTAYLRGSIPSKAVPWRDLGSEASLERLFTPEKALEVLTTLDKIQSHLHTIEQESSNSSNAARGSLRGWIGITFPPTRNARRDTSTVGSSSIPEKLDHLNQLNARLIRLSEDPRVPSEPAPTHVFQTQYSTSLHEIDAGDVYQAIKKGYCCDCHLPHPTKLGLPQIGTQSRSVSRSTRQFSLLFSTHDEMPSESLENSLSLVKSTDSIRTNPRTSSQSLPRFDSEGTPTDQDDHDRRSSQMMSSVDSGTTLNSSNTRSSRAKSCAVTITECTTDGSDLIRDLCDAVKTLSENSSPRPATTIGVLRSRKRKRYSLQTLKFPGTTLFKDIISLEDLFASNQSRFSRKVRIGLALRLSHAVVRYYSTPWITESWSWRDFSMTRAERSQDDCQLFVGHEFYSPEQRVGEATVEKTASSDFLQTYIGEPRLTRLGFALTELALGKRLAELRIEKEQQIEDEEMRDYRTAKRILDTGLIRDEENAQYEDIVKVCLTHQFRSKEMHLRCLNSDERSFQADAEQLIVEPLLGAWTREWPSSVAQAVY